MSELQYLTIEGWPGVYFDCPRGMGRLSVSACADSHRRSMTSEFVKQGRRYQCKSCPIGIAHVDGRSAPDASRLYGRQVCVRCHKGGTRLIRGSICPSCYNREREYLLGLNARGNAPVALRPIVSCSLSVIGRETGSTTVYRVERVTSATEAVLQILSTTRGVVIGWAK